MQKGIIYGIASPPSWLFAPAVLVFLEVVAPCLTIGRPHGLRESGSVREHVRSADVKREYGYVQRLEGGFEKHDTGRLLHVYAAAHVLSLTGRPLPLKHTGSRTSGGSVSPGYSSRLPGSASAIKDSQGSFRGAPAMSRAHFMPLGAAPRRVRSKPGTSIKSRTGHPGPSLQRVGGLKPHLNVTRTVGSPGGPE